MHTLKPLLFLFLPLFALAQQGEPAAVFSQPNINGDTITLSSLKGKYVLIDFWASWCKPCRKENPSLIKAYEKCKGKSFTVVGISLDTKKEAWLEAVKQDGLPWINVCDLKYPNAAAVAYKVNFVPMNFLIDPEGRIVAKNLKGEELEAKLFEILSCDK